MRRLLAGIFLFALFLPATASAEPTGFVESVGLSWLYRPNCFIPMLVNITSDKSGTYQIRVYQEDMDRDEEIFTQTVTLTGAAIEGGNPTQQKFWVYFIPKPTEGGLADLSLRDLQQRLRVFLCDEKGKQITQLPVPQTIQNLESTQAGPYGATRGVRLVVAVSDSARQPVWRDYQNAIGTMEDVVFITLHSFDLPEDVRGYEMVDAIVWLDAPAPDPAKATEEKRYHALRQWVRAGGHLVVCQPPQREATANFDDLLPVTVNSIVSKADLEPLKTLATEKLKEQLDREKNLVPTAGDRTPFGQQNDEDGTRGPGVSDWDGPHGPFMFARATLKPDAIADLMINWKPDGSDDTPYIARIGYGAGAVTWVADDLSDPAITSRAKTGWPFVWNRVLDYKDDLLVINNRTSEIEKAPYKGAAAVDIGRSLISPMELSSKGRALVSIAVVFFIAYWLIAGPGVYVYLLSKSRPQLSWFLFALSAVGATLLTVLVVDLVVRGAPELAHITVVRSCAGEPALSLSRFGLYIPRDGMQELKLPDVQPKEVSYLTAYPEHPAQGSGDIEFPAQMQYVIPLRDAGSDDPVAIDVPYRSTLKKFQARRIGPAGGTIEGAPKLLKNDAGNVQLNGNLLNNTGHKLLNIYFVYHDPVWDDDQIFYVPEWDKSQTLKLENELTLKNSKFLRLEHDSGDNSADPGDGDSKTGKLFTVQARMGQPGANSGWSSFWYKSDFRNSSIGNSSLDDLGRRVPKSFPMMSLFQRLPPMKEFDRDHQRAEVLRRGGRYLDVSNAVAAGRLVVLAQADGQPGLPFPFQVDGDNVTGKGILFYQVILPLEHLEGTDTASATQPTTRSTTQPSQQAKQRGVSAAPVKSNRSNRSMMTANRTESEGGRWPQ
jgi:hypothetical protein